MNTKRIAGILQVLSLFLLIDLATNAQAATYSVKSLDFPGALNTFAASINASGQVAGYYDVAFGRRHGFVYSGGLFMSLDFPGTIGETNATSINDGGQVVGIYADASGGVHGYVYSDGHTKCY